MRYMPDTSKDNNVQNDVPEAFRKRFAGTSGFELPCRKPNRAGLRLPRQDTVFTLMASFAFDNPARFKELCELLESEPPASCFVNELKGYAFYIRGEWKKAAECFMSSLDACPDNVDAWCDLGFCLRHLGLDMGTSIIMQCDLWAQISAYSNMRISGLSSLRQIEKQIKKTL